MRHFIISEDTYLQMFLNNLLGNFGVIKRQIVVKYSTIKPAKRELRRGENFPFYTAFSLSWYADYSNCIVLFSLGI